MTQIKDLDDCDRNILLSLLVTGGVSVIAGCMILASFVFIKKIRTYTFGLIFVMTVAEVISRMAYLLNYNPPSTGTWQCYTQAFVVQYFISLSMYFSLAVAAHMYTLIAARHVFKMTKALFVRVVLGACSFALVCACVPFITDQYGNIGAFCWILLEKDPDDHTSRDAGYSMRVTLMHGQIWVIYILNSLFYIRIYRFITEVTRECRGVSMSRNSGSNRPSGSKDNSVEKTVRILQYYPIILIVTWCPLIVMRVFEYAGSDIPCWVLAFSLGMTNVQGLFNAVVFFSYDSVRQNWSQLFNNEKTRLLPNNRSSSSSTTTSTRQSRDLYKTKDSLDLDSDSESPESTIEMRQ